MHKLLFLAPLCLAVTAHADTPEPQKPKPQPKACAGGDVVINAEHKGRGIDVGSAGITIWDKGAVHVYSHDPKARREVDVMACLTDQEQKDLRAALAKAPWKVTKNAAACDAVAASHTEWSAGKHTFDERLCGAESIDADTQKALALVSGLETAYAKTAPPAPPPPPPNKTAPSTTKPTAAPPPPAGTRA